MEQDIIDLLNNQDKPSLSIIEINDELGLTTIEEYKKLQKTLEEMSIKGIL